MPHFLETDRLALRRFTEADLDHVVGLDSDPQVMRFINGGRPTPREEVRDRVLPRLMRRWACTGEPGFWAAEEKTTRAFLGWFEFCPLDEHSSAVVELGYRLRESAWGNGYATEGARALIREGFADPGLHRVTANTMAVNLGSRRVMEKAGLACVRTYFGDWPEAIEGSEHGEVEYALDRAGWERRAAAT